MFGDSHHDGWFLVERHIAKPTILLYPKEILDLHPQKKFKPAFEYVGVKYE